MSDHNADLFVVSGGPGSGKTTLLDELARLGYPFAPEDARQIIQEQVRLGGTALPWADREAYTRLMLQRSIETYLRHSPSAELIFFDRGIPDTLGYARLIGLSDDSHIQDACRQYRYAPAVFLLPPWREIYTTDTERKQDFAEAERTFEVIRQVYSDCGYHTIEVPHTNSENRAKFVLRQVDRKI